MIVLLQKLLQDLLPHGGVRINSSKFRSNQQSHRVRNRVLPLSLILFHFPTPYHSIRSFLQRLYYFHVFTLAQSQPKFPQAATLLVIHLSGVAQNFIHFYL